MVRHALKILQHFTTLRSKGLKNPAAFTEISITSFESFYGHEFENSV